MTWCYAIVWKCAASAQGSYWDFIAVLPAGCYGVRKVPAGSWKCNRCEQDDLTAVSTDTSPHLRRWHLAPPRPLTSAADTSHHRAPSPYHALSHRARQRRSAERGFDPTYYCDSMQQNLSQDWWIFQFISYYFLMIYLQLKTAKKTTWK